MCVHVVHIAHTWSPEDSFQSWFSSVVGSIFQLTCQACMGSLLTRWVISPAWDLKQALAEPRGPSLSPHSPGSARHSRSPPSASQGLGLAGLLRLWFLTHTCPFRFSSPTLSTTTLIWLSNVHSFHSKAWREKIPLSHASERFVGSLLSGMPLSQALFHLLLLPPLLPTETGL